LGGGTSEGMTFERAQELVEAVNSFAFYGMGLVERPKSIGKATLAELCDAARIIREHSGEPTATGRRVLTHPDDRLIAAVYTATHYQPGSPEEPNVIVLYPPVGLHGKSALCLVEMTEEQEADDGE
jgi:hypothetical protein